MSKAKPGNDNLIKGLKMATYYQKPETNKKHINSGMVQDIMDLIDAQSQEDFLKLYNSLFPAAGLTLDNVDWDN